MLLSFIVSHICYVKPYGVRSYIVSGLDDGQAADALELVTSGLQKMWLTRPCATSMTACNRIHELGESEGWSDGNPTPDDDASIKSLREA